MPEEQQSSLDLELGKLGGLLPEFYYDLISRIVPGAVTVIGLLAAFDLLSLRSVLDKLFTMSGPALVALTLLTGTAGYIVGIWLTLFQFKVRKRYIPGVWRALLLKQQHASLIVARQSDLRLSKYEDRLESQSLSKATDEEVEVLGRSIYGPLHDLLKGHNPQARFVLPKMNGESGMCDNLAIGFVAILVGRVFRLAWVWFTLGAHLSWQSNALALVVLAILSLLNLKVAKVRYRALIERHFSYWSTLPEVEASAMALETTKGQTRTV